MRTVSLFPSDVFLPSFAGVVVAKLPFVPYSLIQRISHRGLDGDDPTDCSMVSSSDSSRGEALWGGTGTRSSYPGCRMDVASAVVSAIGNSARLPETRKKSYTAQRPV